MAPPLAAVLVGAGAAGAVLLILPPRPGSCSRPGCCGRGWLVPWLAAARARQAGPRTAPARGELTARVTDLLAGAADCTRSGAQDDALAAAEPPMAS